MTGGLIQIVARGPQNAYLDGNPTVTFFKGVHRRHTPFSIESIEQTFNGSVQFGQRVSCIVSRNADLMWKVYLQVDTPALAKAGGTVAWVRNLGNTLIDNVELQIGGQMIDRQYGDWMNIFNELTQTAERSDGYDNMIGNTTALTTGAASQASARLYIPLCFWFNRNPSLALPLIALSRHEVKFIFQFRRFTDLVVTDDGGAVDSVPTNLTASLYIDYIYLEDQERDRFTSSINEYLIEQVQYKGEENTSNTSNTFRLSFNHPVKYLAWVCQPSANVASNVNEWDNYTSATGYAGSDPLSTAKLQLNGNDRFRERQGRYFNLVQPYQHFTRVPSTGIYVYSFAINPEEHQPSGSVNMSRLDNVNLLLTLASAVSTNVRIYAVNVNVLRILNGLGGLAFAA